MRWIMETRCGCRAIGSVTSRARSFSATNARCGATWQDAVEFLIRRCARCDFGTAPAKTNAIIRIGSACFLAYPGLTIIVGGAGAIPETDSVRASANAGVHWRPARSAGSGAEDGSADTDRDERPHVSLLLKGAAVKASWKLPDPSGGRGKKASFRCGKITRSGRPDPACGAACSR